MSYCTLTCNCLVCSAVEGTSYVGVLNPWAGVDSRWGYHGSRPSAGVWYVSKWPGRSAHRCT